MRIFLTLFALSAACIARPPRQTLPQDLVAVKNITALALSPDGQRIAFVIREASLAEDKYKSGLWVMPAHGASSPRKVLDDGDSPQWAPGGKKLACLAPRGGLPQIVVLDGDSLAVDLVSSAPSGVVSFQWSPGGRQIAFLSREAGDGATTGNSERGVVIDKRTFSVYKLLRYGGRPCTLPWINWYTSIYLLPSCSGAQRASSAICARRGHHFSRHS